HRRRDDRERKTGEPGDKRGGKRAGEKQCDVECVKLVHGIPHAGSPGMCATRDGATLGQPRRLRGGCHGLRLSFGFTQGEVNRTLRKFSALADAVTFAYMSRTGSCRHPVRRPIVQVLRDSHSEERDHGRTKAATVIASAILRAANLDGSTAPPKATMDERAFGAAARQPLRQQLWWRAAAAERHSRAACES